MRLVIDRIEEGIAVCEELSDAGNRREFKMGELPPESREGDVLNYTNNKLTPNPVATHERKNHIRKLMKNVFD